MSGVVPGVSPGDVIYNRVSAVLPAEDVARVQGGLVALALEVGHPESFAGAPRDDHDLEPLVVADTDPSPAKRPRPKDTKVYRDVCAKFLHDVCLAVLEPTGTTPDKPGSPSRKRALNPNFSAVLNLVRRVIQSHPPETRSVHLVRFLNQRSKDQSAILNAMFAGSCPRPEQVCGLHPVELLQKVGGTGPAKNQTDLSGFDLQAPSSAPAQVSTRARAGTVPQQHRHAAAEAIVRLQKLLPSLCGIDREACLPDCERVHLMDYKQAVQSTAAEMPGEAAQAWVDKILPTFISTTKVSFPSSFTSACAPVSPFPEGV